MRVVAFQGAQRVPALGNRRSACCRAGTGFGKSQGKKDASKPAKNGSDISTAPRTRKRFNVAEELATNRKEVAPSQRSSDPTQDLTKGNWFALANLADFDGDKKRKICELKGSKKTVVLHMFNNALYAMDAFSTAYQYPLIDAKLEDGQDGPTIETPLDGTVYDLRTGNVIKWCPSDGSPIRGLLHSLKASVPPVPLAVYPVAVMQPEGRVMVRLSE